MTTATLNQFMKVQMSEFQSICATNYMLTVLKYFSEHPTSGLSLYDAINTHERGVAVLTSLAYAFLRNFTEDLPQQPSDDLAHLAFLYQGSRPVNQLIRMLCLQYGRRVIWSEFYEKVVEVLLRATEIRLSETEKVSGRSSLIDGLLNATEDTHMTVILEYIVLTVLHGITEHHKIKIDQMRKEYYRTMTRFYAIDHGDGSASGSEVGNYLAAHPEVTQSFKRRRQMSEKEALSVSSELSRDVDAASEKEVAANEL